MITNIFLKNGEAINIDIEQKLTDKLLQIFDKESVYIKTKDMRLKIKADEIIAVRVWNDKTN